MFYDNFKKLCDERNEKPYSLMRKLEVKSPHVIEQWKKGSIPHASLLQKIADYFGVTIDYLINGENIQHSEDPELDEYLEELRSRSEMRMLFKLAKGATKEDVEQAVRIIEAIRKKE